MKEIKQIEKEEEISNGLIVLFIVAAIIACSVGAYRFIENKASTSKITAINK